MSHQDSTHFDTLEQFADAPLTPVQSQVLAALAEGTTVTEAARQAGIHRSAIYNWLPNVPALGDLLDTAAQVRTIAIWDQLLELTDLALDTIRHFVTDENTAPALRLRAALALTRLTRPRPPEPSAAAPETPDTARNLAVQQYLDRLSSPETLAKMKRAADKLFAEYQAANGWTAAPPEPAGTPRNAPCPCGSGEKYKRCCGAAAPPVLNRPGFAAA